MFRSKRTVHAGLIVLATLFFLVFVSDDSEAATIDVDKFGGADYTNITKAVENSTSGDTIRVAARTYHDTVLVNKQLTILGANEGGSGTDPGNIFGPSCDSGNLVARYNLDETGSATLADDGVGCNNLEGSLEGDASWESGVWENGIEFDGVDDYIEVDHDSAFNITDTISIALWAKWDTNGTYNLVSTKPSSVSDGGYVFFVYDNGNNGINHLSFHFYDDDGGDNSCNSLEVDDPLVKDTWYHLAVTYDQSKIKLYLNGHSIKECATEPRSIGTNTQPFTIGKSAVYGSDFDGTIDDVAIWNTALSASNIQALHWSGDGNSYYPIVNASDGGYSFKITADDVVLKKFEVQYTSDAGGDAGIVIDHADDVTIDKIRSKYNNYGIYLDSSDRAKIYSVSINCDSHNTGLYIESSDGIDVRYGNYDCATHAGIYSMYSKGGVYRDLDLDSNHRGIFFYAIYGVPNSVSSNYINDTNIYNSGNAAIYFDGADNNTVYGGNIHDQWNGITFKNGANDNTVRGVDFQESSNYDIYHSSSGGCGGTNYCGGWANVLIDNDFDDFDLYIDSVSRLLEKELVETTITGNGTHAWNRIDTSIDDDRKAFSGDNSFWVGYSEDDEYLDDWANVSYQLSTDVSLPSGGDEENRILEIKTWYETQDNRDGGRVYISKNSGVAWSPLTPVGGYDSNLNGPCFDGGAFNGDKSGLGWQTKNFNLSDYRGEDIRIKFNFCSDDTDHEYEGWYIDDVKIYKVSDSSIVSYFDDFERLGHQWILPGDWITTDTPSYYGHSGVDLIVVDESSAESLLNKSYNSNLVNHWKFDESSGTYTYDSITGYNAYLYQATFTSGKFGNGINFDGSNDYARNTNYMYQGTQHYTKVTISAWVKFDTFPSSGNYETLVNPRYDGDALLQVNSDGKPVFGGYFYNPTGEQRAIGTTTMVTGVWYHLVGTWSEDTDKLKIYLNGSLDGTYSMSSSSSYLRDQNAYNYFGRDYNGNYLDGILDHVSIWSVDLSASEIQILYKFPHGGDTVYSTSYYGGSDSKTNSRGKIKDLYVTTKVYGGNSIGVSTDSYAGFRFDIFIVKPTNTAINNEKFEDKIPDTLVYNRNSNTQYYTFQEAVDAASSSDVLELWPGRYQETVDINKRLTILGSGTSKTIIDARYQGSPIYVQNSGDYTTIQDLRVTHSQNSTSSGSSSGAYAGIRLYQADSVTISNVYFFETYNGLITYYLNDLVIKNSTFEAATSGYYGIHLANSYNTKDSLLLENSEIQGYRYGIYMQSLYKGIDIYNNYIHNNTGLSASAGIYINSVSYSTYALGNPLEIVGNRLVDNRYGVYRADTSNNWGRYVLFKDNLVKSSSDYGVRCYYYCKDWIVENNTFEGDNDQVYGWYGYYRGYKTIFGNNTFSNHTSKDIYIRQCGTGSNSNKFFNNTYSSITVTNSCYIDVYDYLTVRTLETGGDPFSDVEIELNDTSNIYYQTSHWGGSDAITNSQGYLPSNFFLSSGYYSSSSTLTSNEITLKYAYGVRAKWTIFNFSGDSTKSVTVPDNFRLGIVKNENTGDLYTTISLAISSSSTSDVIKVWNWTFNEEVLITKGITLVGNSTSTSIINGTTHDYAIDIQSNGVTVKNLSLEGASDSTIHAGNYQTIVIKNILILSTSADIGLHFENTDTVTVSNVTVNNTDRKSVFIDNGDSITFKNCNFKNSSSSHGFQIDLSDDITLDNVFIHNSGYSSTSSYGITISDSSSITIKNSSKVANSKSYTLYVDTVSSLVVQNSQFIGKELVKIDESNGFLIENSTFTGNSQGDYSIYIKSTSGATFRNNVIMNPSSDASSPDNGGIFLSSSSFNLVKNNTVTNSGRSGIHLKSGSVNNEIYDNSVTNSYIFGLYVQSSHNNKIRNNTFSSSGSNGIKLTSSDNTIIDNNTLNSNTNYGLYISSSDNIIAKYNSINMNNVGVYVTTSDDSFFLFNEIDDHSSYGVHFQESKDIRFKHNTIKNSDSDALFLSLNCDDAFIDNNTIKNNGVGTSGRAIRFSEIDTSTIYNNTIKANTYSGIILVSSSSNNIVQNIIDDNGAHGIQISNDAQISDNNTIKDNTINDNFEHGISSESMFTKIINNTIKFNDKDGINLEQSAARSTISSCTIEDNEENAIHVFADNVVITLNIIDGDSSEIAVLVSSANSVNITYNTIEGGSQGIKLINSLNSYIFNNTIKSNDDYGLYLLTDSNSVIIKNNTIEDNGNYGLYIHTSNSSVITGNILKDNDDYAAVLTNSILAQISNNTIEDNAGGIKYNNCDYCNITSTTIKDNSARGLWLLSGSDNNYFEHLDSSDNSVDVYFQSSVNNKGFNFSFSTINLDSDSLLTLTSNLNIAFQSSNGSAFQGVEFELISGGVQFYATPFYGGTDSVSDSNGEVSETFSLDYKIYNGSSTPDIVSNILKYHYGVRSKEKSIDMSTSHTETVSVPSNWIKGLVRNADTGTDYSNIQDAIDNASAGHTLNVWAWIYNEVILIDESITLIGNSSSTTNIIAGTEEYDSGNPYVVKITADNVVVKNLNFTATTSDFDILYSSNNDSISLLNNIFYYNSAYDSSTRTVKLVNGDNHIISGNIIYFGEGNLLLNDVTNSLVNNNLLYSSGTGGSLHVEYSDNNIFENNTLDDLQYGMYFGISDYNIIRNNTVISQMSNCYSCISYGGIRLGDSDNNTIIANNVTLSAIGVTIGGGSGSHDNTISDNNLSNNNIGIYFYESNNNKVEDNVIKDSTSLGIQITNSTHISFWNNTIASSGTYDLKFVENSTDNTGKNTTFSTIYVHANAYFAIYNDLSLTLVDTLDSGFEGADVKVVNDENILYSTSYYGGTDNKTDSNGTITKDFTLIFEIYDGSSTPVVIPTNISARYLDWDETSSLEPSSSLKIIVPDFRVKNNRTGVLTYNIQTSIDDAISGDILFAWAGIYYEYLEIGNPLTIRGNGTSTIVDGTFTEGYEEREGIFEITSNDVTISDLLVSGSNDLIEEGISVIGSDDVTIRNVKFINNTISIYVDDSTDLEISQSTFDVSDYGIYATGSSTRIVIEQSKFRNGTSGNACIYQLPSDDNGNGLIRNNTFDDCYTAWKSGSNANVFQNNTLNDNINGIQLNGVESYDNLVSWNTISDSDYGIFIYNSAKDNRFFNNIIQDSSNFDIKLGESEDTILVNTTFSSISVATGEANMWIKVYLNFVVYDNSSNGFVGADVKVMEDSSTIYSTDGFGGSDPKTDGNGSIGTFLVATKHYDGNDEPDNITTNITVKYVDWILSETYNVNSPISVSIDDFRVKNENTGVMYYSISGAVGAASNSHIIHVWAGTYREKITINKQITLVGNSTSNTILNGSNVPGLGFGDSIITITSVNVVIKNLSLLSSDGNAILVNANDCDIENVYAAYNNNAGVNTGASFIKIFDSTFRENGLRGIELQGASEVSIINNTFIDDARGINIYNSNDVTIRDNTISSNEIGIISTGSDDVEIYRNLLHNNTNEGLTFDGGSSNSEAHNNSIEYNGDYGISVSGADSLLISDNIIKENTKGFRIIAADGIIFLSNTFISNDGGLSAILTWGGISGVNRLENNTFDDTEFSIEGSNQTLIGNIFKNSPGYGIKLTSEYCDDNVLYHNTITNSNNEDIFVGGSGNQTNNIGYNNTFSTIEVESNGEFIILDFVNVKTVNASGDMSGIDVYSYYHTSSYYKTSYFDGSDALTNSTGSVPSFIAPIEYYGGSSTAEDVLLPVQVRFVDWVEIFYLDNSQGNSITIDIPDLRVKNVDTEEMSYHIQTAINNANTNDQIYVTEGVYLENVVVNKKIVLSTCLPEFNSICISDESNSENVLIDAQQSGSGITITANSAEILGFEITNSSSWPESGIRVTAHNTLILGCSIYNTESGILLQDVAGTVIIYNTIFQTDIGIWLTSSSNSNIQINTIYDSSITDVSLDSYGYADSEGSEDNVFLRMEIRKINFTNSPDNRIIWPNSENFYQFDKVTLVNSENIETVGYDDPASIEIDSDSSYFVKNQLNINVTQNETYLSDVDVKIWNDTEIFYATSGYGGSDSKTVAGTMLTSVEFVFKEYIGSSVGTENSIKIEITYIDFVNKTTLSGNDGYPGFCYQCTIYADFDIPVFRVYNENSGNGYYYLQSAIDSATSGDKLHLSSGYYYENIEIDKSLTITGQGISETIISGDVNDTGLGSPPVDGNDVGIYVTANNVIIKSLQVRHFSSGFHFFTAASAQLENVKVLDTSDIGIEVELSTNIHLKNVIVDGSQKNNLEIDSSSTGATVEDSLFINSELSGIKVFSDDNLFNNITSENNAFYGLVIDCSACSGFDVTTISNSHFDNQQTGIWLTSSSNIIVSDNSITNSGWDGISILGSNNIELYNNSISSSQDWSIYLNTTDSLIILDNIITGNRGIYSEGNNNELYNNSFNNMIDKAIFIRGNNNIFDNNQFTDTNIAYLFNSGDNNLLINNTYFANTIYDLSVFSLGLDNAFINNTFSSVQNTNGQQFEFSNVINLEMRTVEGPANNIQLEIFEGDTSIYATSYYSGSSATTDIDGKIAPINIVYERYNSSGLFVLNSSINYYYDNTEYTDSLDTSNSHDEIVWVNTRAVALIESFTALGDLPGYGIEAVKGADINITDSYTVAYWSFDEGQGALVYDEVDHLPSQIKPTPIWSPGNSNSISDYSIGFDGTFTNLDLTLFELEEFTGELWFKTSDSKTMVLFSDKKLISQGWGYNFYISTTLNFDFTTNSGNVHSLSSTEAVNDGNWHFASVVRSSDKVQLWLDKELVAETSWSGIIDFTDEPIRIGQTPAGSDSFKGSIDDFRLSNIARHNEDFMNGGGVVELISNSYDIDGSISEYIWMSMIDGELGRGQTLYYPVNNLTQGSHTIQLTVVDSNGTISNPISSVLLVMERPISHISSIQVDEESVWSGWGSVNVNSGDQIVFSGETTSQQTIVEYYWSSSQDGVLCNGNEATCSTFSINTLSNGTHEIFFRVQGGNGLWSSDYILNFDINGRPVIGTPEVTQDTIPRLKSAVFRVSIDDDSTSPEFLNYTVGYRVKGNESEWESEYIENIDYNTDTEELEFTFTPDEYALTGEYEFYIEAKDEEDATLSIGSGANYYVIDQTILVQNNQPVIVKDSVPLEFVQGSPIILDISTSDEDGIVSTVIWYADEQQIGTGANFTFEDNTLEPGNHTIKVRVLDNEGGYSEQTFEVFVTASANEESTIQGVLTDFSNNLPLIGLLAFGMIMVVGTVLLRRNRSTDTVVEGLAVDDGVSEVPLTSSEIHDWEIPTDAQGNALIIGEYMAKRRESYLTHPNNEEAVDFLHNNRERFAISSYFDVPGDPTVVVNDWALPENLRGNVHLDSFRQQIVERITNSTPEKNFVIIGEPGVGKTVMLFEVFDRLMNQAPVGILSTDTIAKAHEMFGVRVFYDDLPENQKLVDALTENEVQGVIVSSREADWKALPTEMQAKFDRLTVPLFSELDMKAMIKKMMTFQSIGYNDDSIDILAEYAEGSPIYVWSMVREMMHRGVKTLTKEYIKENSVKGMINYVAQLLQRLLKDGEEYRKGGLHALASLIFLSDHMEERYCNDYFFDAYVEVLSKYTEDKLDDKMNPKTLNLVLAYLPINDSVIRFPHDTWPDVLQGWGDMNPFSSELRMINRAFADSGIFQDLKKEVVADVWNSTYERYKRTPSRQKNSFLALADTLFQNFTIDELKELDVDIDIVRQVASTYSHIPQAAKLISKIQAVLPQTVTRIINMQDLGSEKSHTPYKIQEMYLIYNDGRMITSLMDKEAKVDSDIMSSMLTAINDFVKDSFQTSGNLGSIDYGENQIILERGKYTILASVVYGEANRDLRSRMSRALTKMEDLFGSKLKSWNGDVDSLSGTTEHLEPIMALSQSVTRDMIDELQALRSINLRSSWTQIAGFVQVNLLLNNYSKKQIKGAKLTLEYGTDFLKLVKTEPEYKYKVNEVDIKKIPANDEMPVTLYFEPLKSSQASLNVHLDYEAKGGHASGVSSAVFERVNLFKEGQALNISDIVDAPKAEIVVEAVSEDVEVLESTVEEVEIAPEIEEKPEEVKKEKPPKVEEEPKEPGMDPGESGVDDIMSKLDELDDSAKAPKKKKAKSDEKKDESGMDDLLGKLDEL